MVKTQKIEAQIVDAIRSLQAVQGSTQREISNYIAQEYNLPLPSVNRQVQLALKRGVNYGILQRLKGGCFTYNQQLFNGLPFDMNPELPCKGRRKGRKSRRRKSRKRRKSKRRNYSIRDIKRRSKKADDIVKEIDTSELKTLTKQTNNRSSSLLRKDTPESEGSSTTGKSEEAHE
ncbi:uncharacterized protein LOC100882772 [Megachile rotundata]|uniref:uncharacterized protein LOC100882772 n=1 Tax=Megachile rotundata TaxID=143995 RepID=UPI000258E341|nr:PREDICTED: uncharacterized protein LOC100882772 [Megachile rotundata]